MGFIHEIMKPFNWFVEEKDIHTYILESYDSLGYDCINFHESGACVEGGIDILSNKPGNNIGIAVKIKPQKKDIKQLKKLASNDSKRKIYVYIKDPTRPFFDALKKLKESNKIEVLNAKSLHDFLIKTKNTKYIKKYFYSHKVFTNLTKIMSKWYSVKENKPLKPCKDDLKLLWDWKDKSVSFHKISKVISDYMKPKIKEISSEDDGAYFQVMKEVISFLDYINHEVKELDSIFETVKQTNSNLLSYMWQVCRSRSSWCTLLSHLECKGNKESLEEIFFIWFFQDLGDGAYTLLADILDNIKELGDNFETAVDWMFQDRKK